MALRFLCFNCSAKIKVPDGTQGRKVKCPSCGSLQRVPDPQAPQAHVESAAPESQAPQASVPQATSVRKAKQPTADDNATKNEEAAKSSKHGKRSKKASAGYASSMPSAKPTEPPAAPPAPVPPPAPEPEPESQSLKQPADDADAFDTDSGAMDPLAALAAAAGNEPGDDLNDDLNDDLDNHFEDQQSESADEHEGDDTDDVDDADDHSGSESPEAPSYELADDGLTDQPPQPELEEVTQAPVPLEIKDDEPEPVNLQEQEDEPVQAPAADQQPVALEKSDEEPTAEEPTDEESTDEESDDELAQAMAAAANAASADDDSSDLDESPEPEPEPEPDTIKVSRSKADRKTEDESPALPWTDVNAAADRQDHEDQERAAKGDSAAAHLPTSPESDDALETSEPPVQAKPAAVPATPKAIPLGHASTFRSTMARPQPVPGVATQSTGEKQPVNQGLPEAKVHHPDNADVANADVANDITDDITDDMADDNAGDDYDDSPSPGGFDDNAADQDTTQNDIAAQAFAAESAQEASLAQAAAAGVIPVAAAAAGVAASTPAYGSSTSAPISTSTSTSTSTPTSAAHQPRGLYRSLKVATTTLRIIVALLFMLAIGHFIALLRVKLNEQLFPNGYMYLMLYTWQVFIPLGLAATAWGIAECCAAARELLRR